jgi:hypothetical protein
MNSLLFQIRTWTVQVLLLFGEPSYGSKKESESVLMAGKAKNAAAKPQNGQGDRKPPVKEFKLGAVRASIWINQGTQGPWYSVTLSRRYLQGQDWKTASSYGRDNLFAVAEVCRLAAVWCYENPANKAGDNDGHDGEQNGNGEDPGARF